MSRYQVVATRKRTRKQVESPILATEDEAYDVAYEWEDLGIYETIIITEDQEGKHYHGNAGVFFLHRIIK